MAAFDKMDSWKACFALTTATYEAITAEVRKRDEDIASRLTYCPMRATGRVAFGSAINHRLHRAIVAGSAAGWLSDYGSTLELARTMGVVAEPVFKDLDALRGRALFYVDKWHWETMAPPKQK